MERALAAIHQANRDREPLTLIYATTEGRVGLFLRFAEYAEEYVTGPIAANYPNCALTAAEGLDAALPGWRTWFADLELSPELFPILRHVQFEDLLNRTFADPINGLLRAIRSDDRVRCQIEIQIVPTGQRRRRAARRAIRLLDREFFRVHYRLADYFAERITRPHRWFFAWLLGLLAWQSPHRVHTAVDTSSSRLHDREDHEQAAADKIGGHLFDTHIQLIAHAPADSRQTAVDRIQQMAGAFGAFTQSRLAMFRLGRVRHGRPPRTSGKGSLLSHEELATLWHPPTATVAAERMQISEFTELEPPAKFYSGIEAGAVTIGRVRFREDDRIIGIDEDSRRRHVYIVGSTGAGKSTLLLNLIQQDMLAGRGLTVIDVPVIFFVLLAQVRESLPVGAHCVIDSLQVLHAIPRLVRAEGSCSTAPTSRRMAIAFLQKHKAVAWSETDRFRRPRSLNAGPPLTRIHARSTFSSLDTGSPRTCPA